MSASDFSSTDLTKMSTQSLEAELARRNAEAGLNDGRTETTEVRGDGSTAGVSGVPAGGSAAQTQTDATVTDATQVQPATGATTSDVKLSEVPAPEETDESAWETKAESFVDEELSKVVNELFDHIINYAVNPSALIREVSALKARVFPKK